MSTPGYEPYTTLWHFFNESDAITAKLALTPPQLEQIKQVVADVTENRSNPEASPLVDRFEALMAVKGHALNPNLAPLAGGLLECLNPYQSYEPFTHEDRIQRGIYDHFKGGVYLVTGLSSWASGNGELVVEYLSMLFATPHTRLASQWCEVVKWPDEKYRSRFVYRSPDLKTHVPKFKVPSPV
jgi:hypothetical protein